jgi:hypothetical protein
MKVKSLGTRERHFIVGGRKSIVCWKVPRLLPLVLLIRVQGKNNNNNNNNNNNFRGVDSMGA